MTANPRKIDLDASESTVSCNVRAPMLLEPIDSHVKTLQVCESKGLIERVMLRSWPAEVTLSPDGPERAVLERFESFREWADQVGVNVEPPFKIRTRKSLATGEETDLLVLPLICLAVYYEGDLVGVYPHSDDEETYTVEDAIARLRTGEVPVPLSTTSVRVENTETCPDCNGALVNGQGLYACPDCAWAGSVTPDSQFEPLTPLRSGSAEVSLTPDRFENTDTTAESDPFPMSDSDIESSTGSDDDRTPLKNGDP